MNEYLLFIGKCVNFRFERPPEALVHYSIHTTIRYAAHNLLCKRYPLFVRSSQRRSSNEHSTCLNTRLTELLLNWRIALFNIFSLENIYKMESSCSRLPEKSSVTVCTRAFPYISFPHVDCCWFRCSMYSCTH